MRGFCYGNCVKTATRRLTKKQIDRITAAPTEQAQQQVLAAIVLGWLGVYGLVRLAEFGFGSIRRGMDAVNARVVASRPTVPPTSAA